jgi:hypothetical protein
MHNTSKKDTLCMYIIQFTATSTDTLESYFVAFLLLVIGYVGTHEPLSLLYIFHDISFDISVCHPVALAIYFFCSSIDHLSLPLLFRLPKYDYPRSMENFNNCFTFIGDINSLYLYILYIFYINSLYYKFS